MNRKNRKLVIGAIAFVSQIWIGITTQPVKSNTIEFNVPECILAGDVDYHPAEQKTAREWKTENWVDIDY